MLMTHFIWQTVLKPLSVTDAKNEAVMFVIDHVTKFKVFTQCVCVFITAGPNTKLFAGGGRRRVEDMCYEK
jgi:hypothetical protein